MNEFEKFIPRYYLKKSRIRGDCNHFTGSVLNMDISGFSKITQQLMSKGKQGAEILNEILYSLFKPCIEIIWQSSGFISSFSGDSIMAIFADSGQCNPDISRMNSWKSAVKIREIFSEIDFIKLSQEKFKVKIGLSWGEIYEQVFYNEYQNIYLFWGPAISQAAELETKAGPDDILSCREYLNIAEKSGKYSAFNQYLSFPEFSFKQEGVVNEKAHHNLSEIKLEISEQEKFINPQLRNIQISAEFRSVVACFISFDINTDLYRFVEEVNALCIAFGGYIRVTYDDKGGVILVLFGAPRSYENICLRAAEFSSEVMKIDPKSLKIGMSFGIAYTGLVGSDYRAEYTALGSRVNLAARFMTSAKPGEVLIDDNLNRELIAKYSIKRYSPRNFKGFREKIKYFALQDKLIEDDRDSNFQIFVGRLEQQNLIFEKFKHCLNKNQNYLIYIDGLPGVGKTALVDEVKKHTGYLNWLYFYGEDLHRQSFNSIINFLNNYFYLSGKISNQEKINRINRKIDKLKKIIESQDMADSLELSRDVLPYILELKTTSSTLNSVEEKDRLNKIFDAVKNLIWVESIKSPVVIRIDNGHYLDDDSADFFNCLLDQTYPHPVIIIISCRIIEQQLLDILNYEYSARILVSNLNQDQSRALSELLLSARVSEQLLDILWIKSGGNPLFIQQIISFLLHEKLMEKHDGFYFLKKTDFEIPDNLNAFIAARIDTLDENFKKLVKVAAVIGDKFDPHLLAEIVGKDDIEKNLQQGEKHQLWEKITPEQYLFKHKIISETVYNMHTKKDLVKIHQSIAEKMNQMYQDCLENYYDQLAFHYERGNMIEKAKDILLKSANSRSFTNISKYNLNLYIRILDFTADNEEKFQILNKILWILNYTGNWPDSEVYHQQALSLVKEIENKYNYGTILASYGWLKVNTGFYDEAEKLLNEAKEIFENSSFDNILTDIYLNLGNIYFHQGDYDLALKNYMTTYRYAVKSSFVDSLKKSLVNLGMIHLNKGKLNTAEKIFNKAIEISRNTEDIVSYSYAVGNLGNVYYYMNQFDKSLQCYKQQLNSSKKYWNRKLIALALGNIGVVYNKLGEYELAEDYFNRKLVMAAEIGDKVNIAHVYSSLGELNRYRGDYPVSLNYFEKSVEMLIELNSKFLLTEVLLLKSFVEHKLGENDLALKSAQHSKKIALEIDHELMLYRSNLYCLVYRKDISIKLKEEKLTELLSENSEDLVRLVEINAELYKLTSKKKYKNKVKQITDQILAEGKDYEVERILAEIEK